MKTGVSGMSERGQIETLSAKDSMLDDMGRVQ